MKKYLGILAAGFMILATLPASAASINLGLDPTPWNTDNVAVLTVTPTVPAGNQVDNIPCLICGKNQPQQPAGFGYNLFGNTGNQTTVSFFSTAVVPPNGSGSGLGIDQFAGATGYNIGDGSLFKAALLGNLNFAVGFDVNDTSTPQTLESFWFLNLSTHTVLAAFSPGPGGMLVPAINNGTGYPDYTISGFSLNGISQGDQIMFFARITGANDGPDSFFLVAEPQATPLPAVGAGIPGLIAAMGGYMAWRKRRQKQKETALLAAA